MLVFCFLEDLPVSNVTLFVLLFFFSLSSVSALSGHSTVFYFVPPQKTRKSPLPSDASERIVRVESELSEDNMVFLNNFPYRSL